MRATTRDVLAHHIRANGAGVISSATYLFLGAITHDAKGLAHLLDRPAGAATSAESDFGTYGAVQDVIGLAALLSTWLRRVRRHMPAARIGGVACSGLRFASSLDLLVWAGSSVARAAGAWNSHRSIDFEAAKEALECWAVEFVSLAHKHPLDLTWLESVGTAWRSPAARPRLGQPVSYEQLLEQIVPAPARVEFARWRLPRIGEASGASLYDYGACVRAWREWLERGQVLPRR